MAEAILFAVVASIALPLGALIAVWRPPPRPVTAALLGFASGALVAAVAFELFAKAFEHGGAVGLALLAGVTLDGIPENLAMGVALVEGGAATLLVAIFASNLPEAIVGAEKMKEEFSARQILLVWTGTAALLAVAVIVGYGALRGVPHESLAWPLGFAAGAVLASLADTLMPEAFKEGGPPVAYATALGFLLSFMVSSAAHPPA